MENGRTRYECPLTGSRTRCVRADRMLDLAKRLPAGTVIRPVRGKLMGDAIKVTDSFSMLNLIADAERYAIFEPRNGGDR